MFCTACGKSLPKDFKYIVCDPCFRERRADLLSRGDPEQTHMRAPGVYGSSGMMGFSGFSGFTGVSGFNYQEPTRAEQPPPSYYVYSERADEVKKQIAKEKLHAGRMIRCQDENESDGPE